VVTAAWVEWYNNRRLHWASGSLRNVSLCPWKIGTIVAAALVVLHIEHHRTT